MINNKNVENNKPLTNLEDFLFYDKISSKDINSPKPYEKPSKSQTNFKKLWISRGHACFNNSTNEEIPPKERELLSKLNHCGYSVDFKQEYKGKMCKKIGKCLCCTDYYYSKYTTDFNRIQPIIEENKHIYHITFKLPVAKDDNYSLENKVKSLISAYDYIQNTTEWEEFLAKIDYTGEFITAFECPYNLLYGDLPHLHTALIGKTHKNYKEFEYYLNRDWINYLQNILPNYDYESFRQSKENNKEIHQQGIYLNSNDEKKFKLNYLVSVPKLYAGMNTDTNDKSKVCSQFKKAFGTSQEQKEYLNYLHILGKYNIQTLKFSTNFEKTYRIGNFAKYKDMNNAEYEEILEEQRIKAKNNSKKSYFRRKYKPNGMKNTEFNTYYQWSLSHRYRGESVNKDALYAEYKREKEEFLKKYPKNCRKMANREWKEIYSA